MQFLGYYVSALRACCAMKFLHALEIDQGYLAHTPTGTGVPPKNLSWTVKIWPKIQRVSHKNFSLLGVSSWNFFRRRATEAAVIKHVQLSEAPPPIKNKNKNWEGQKTWKFRRDFWQLSTLIANISGTDRHIEHLRQTWSTTTPSTLGEKNFGELWSTNIKVLLAHIDQSTWTFFWRLHFGHYGVLRHKIFTRARDWRRLPSAHPDWDGVPPPPPKKK